MEFHQTPLEGLILIRHKSREDMRGSFMETYQQETFSQHGIRDVFVQDNLSVSHRGVLRGLHAQAGPQAQGKLVRVIRGRVWDVAVDIRAGSPSYGKHYALELSGDQPVSFWIPKGFLHGFLCLEDDTIFTYKVTGFYDPGGEVGVQWNDPSLDIDWPVQGQNLIISDKDRSLPLLENIRNPFCY